MIPAMGGQDKGRIVYSTGKGRICPVCGWPEGDCRCSSALSAGDEPVPARVTAKLRIETKGRGGKTVTVASGFQLDGDGLKKLAAELKRRCGTGGSVKEREILVQGDHRETLLAELKARGFTPKLSGG
jgi:translation initiation factor 1